jgi:hypothetical protein
LCSGDFFDKITPFHSKEKGVLQIVAYRATNLMPHLVFPCSDISVTARYFLVRPGEVTSSLPNLPDFSPWHGFFKFLRCSFLFLDLARSETGKRIADSQEVDEA